MEGSSMDNRIVLLSESSDWMDILEVLALSMTGSGGGGDSARPASILEALWTP
jgi:hypothetical protein